MKNEIIWVKRKFKLDLPVEMFPIVVERLRGVPARLEEKIAPLPDDILRHKEGNAWSILEVIGHLGDVEALWHGRIDDYLENLDELRPANITNTVTNKADHNSASVEELLGAFRKSREHLVNRFDEMTNKHMKMSAYHRRLDTQMRMIDHALFIAEHDDHHLSKITDMINEYSR
ncbi:MAG: DinB family protein [candidate division Zixibacteria bacterium HGW-Zixibacteria-1]|nr:MAG: DinB family protein [candidate division Zixibacteria bacterium HGW-Zixibacteria-1]